MTQTTTEVKPTDEEFQAWFKERFFDTREYGPKKGQVLSRYRAVAHFVDAWVKRNVINMLINNKVGAENSLKVLRKMCGVTEPDAIRVALEMSDDLVAGMTVEEVTQKEYKMIIEFFFWTQPEYIPDDPHWSKIDILESKLESSEEIVNTLEN